MSVQVEIAREKIEEFCRRWKIVEMALFGSVLREDFGAESDVDVLVSLAEDAAWSLFDWVEMQNELGGLFGREVNLVEKAGLRNPFRRNAILHSKEEIYASR